MSKERARRRAVREAAAAQARADQEAKDAQRARRRTRWERLVPRTVRYRAQGGLLARRRRLRNRAVFGAVVLIQVVGWILLDSWPARLALLGLSVFLTPVFVTLAFDRRR